MKKNQKSRVCRLFLILNVLQYLVDTFDLRMISNAEEVVKIIAEKCCTSYFYSSARIRLLTYGRLPESTSS